MVSVSYNDLQSVTAAAIMQESFCGMLLISMSGRTISSSTARAQSSVSMASEAEYASAARVLRTARWIRLDCQPRQCTR
eukprot:12970513-Heterocapsa_arctica.AAC.1